MSFKHIIIFELIFMIISIESSTTTTNEPTVQIVYSNGLSVNSPTFVRPNGIENEKYYYHALQLTIWKNGKYLLRSNSSIDTYCCLYKSSFDPTNVNRNILICDDDSGIDLESNVEYILVVTTYNYLTIGNYSIIGIGRTRISINLIVPTTHSSPITKTTSGSFRTSWFSGGLTAISPTFRRPGSTSREYSSYESIELITYVQGYYKLRSNSSFDTSGCLYIRSFNSLEPYLNEIVCDGDSGGSRQFLIDYLFESRQIYILVVTTQSSVIHGNYSVSVIGLGSVLMNSITPVESTFNGQLTTKSPKFIRPGGSSTNYYYNSILFRTSTTSDYTIISRSFVNSYGCLYNGSFHWSNPTENLIVCDDDTAGDLQFLIRYLFISNRDYILVVTTSTTYSIGNYSIVVTGLTLVNMTSITPN